MISLNSLKKKNMQYSSVFYQRYVVRKFRDSKSVGEGEILSSWYNVKVAEKVIYPQLFIPVE